MCYTNLLNLLQPLLQRTDGVLLSLQAFQAGDELGCKLCRLHWDHLFGRMASTLLGINRYIRPRHSFCLHLHTVLHQWLLHSGGIDQG